ncbi:MAG: hypothetical protein K2I95_10435 [Treponemataceae bacterium]|nr:hypothetical protein [Treponemataceae bacterium]
MKKEIEIEKWFRAKGTDTYFKTASEAEEYARTEYAKELLQQIRFANEVKNETAKHIKQMRAMIEEAKSNTLDLREVWEIKEWNGSFSLLCRKATDVRVKLFADADLSSRESLHFLREFVIYQGKRDITKCEATIRHYKAVIKELSRTYENLRGGISKC